MDEHRDALLHLHSRAGAFGDLDPGAVPGFTPPSDAEALGTVARADERDVSVAARLSLLHDLAKADFLPVGGLNVYDVLRYPKLVIAEGVIRELESRLQKTLPKQKEGAA